MPIDGKAVQCGCAILALLYCRAGCLVIWIWLRVVRKPLARRDATLTMILSGLREFQQMGDFCSSIGAQSPCAWARAMEAGLAFPRILDSERLWRSLDRRSR